MDVHALLIASVLGTILQVAMVVAGHSNKAIAKMFAVGGMGISLVAGLAYTLLAGAGASPVLGGTAAGAVCALIGIGVSYALKDVPASLLLLGTASSAVTGAIGGFIGKFLTH